MTSEGSIVETEAERLAARLSNAYLWEECEGRAPLVARQFGFGESIGARLAAGGPETK
jgi:hypothetical protein